jgi:glycosyltransferase involved in cell wall biosynthesis
MVLFDSFVNASLKPGYFIIVDNDNDRQVLKMCNQLQDKIPHNSKVIYAPQETNTGGSGGFSAGAKIAYEMGVEWIWFMDDDVKILPHALSTLRTYMDNALENNHRVIQCRRINYDGTPFYWQYHFLNHLGIPNPVAPSGYKRNEKYRKMNTACFEGGMFHRSIVQAIGLPDNRFFIYWDDTIYGYLASKITTPILINDMLMARTRPLKNVSLGTVRKLNSTSNMARYYIMRNRGYMAKYFSLHGDYRPFVFWIGTQLTMCKELIRLCITKEFKSGIKELLRGKKDAKKIMKSSDWKPMPKLG